MKLRIFTVGLISWISALTAYSPIVVSHFSKYYIGSYPLTYLPLAQINTSNLLQTPNSCGPYVAFFVAEMYKPDPQRDIKTFIKNFRFRIIESVTLPAGIEKSLNDLKIKNKRVYLSSMSNDKKLEYLKYKISQNKSVIAITRPIEDQPLSLHYVLIVGYDKEYFHLYDPNYGRKDGSQLTVDYNGKILGNRPMKFKEFFDRLNNGAVGGLEKDYLLIVN